MTKEQELIEKLKTNKDLREKLLKATTMDEALQAVKDAGVDFDKDEFEKMISDHGELLKFYHGMEEKRVTKNMQTSAFDVALAAGPFE